MNSVTTHTSARPFDPAAFDQRHTRQQRAGCQSFGIGQVHVTPGARSALAAVCASHEPLLLRHKSGQWDGTPADEQAENHAAIREGRGVFTMHTVQGVRVWITTSEDRSRTLIFTPDEV